MRTHRSKLRLAHTALLLAGIALATSANALSCLPTNSQLPQNQVQDFMNNPGALLATYPNGGGGLETMITKLVASDSTALPAVMQLLSQPGTTPQQSAAIGAGLAGAALNCLNAGQAQFAGEIQTALVASGNRNALTAFVSAGGQDTGTAAIGAPGAPGATAFVSGAAQVTGNSQSQNNGNVAGPGNNAAGGGNVLVFTGGSGPGGPASQPVSP